MIKNKTKKTTKKKQQQTNKQKTQKTALNTIITLFHEHTQSSGVSLVFVPLLESFALSLLVVQILRKTKLYKDN